MQHSVYILIKQRYGYIPKMQDSICIFFSHTLYISKEQHSVYIFMEQHSVYILMEQLSVYILMEQHSVMFYAAKCLILMEQHSVYNYMEQHSVNILMEQFCFLYCYVAAHSLYSNGAAQCLYS